MRAAGNLPKSYDIDAILATLEELDQPFCLFGGEALLAGDADLRRLFELGLSRHGANKLQTNATLVNEADLALFRDYAVQVGVSIDGPGALNDLRWAGSARLTRRATARTEAVIERLCRISQPPRIIITLHRVNAGPERLPGLCEWLCFLDRQGIASVRLHVLERDDPDMDASLVLTEDEALAALRRLRSLESGLSTLRFDLFGEITAMLRADDAKASCVFHACDPYATQAVVGVEGDGRITNCGRTNKDGVGFLQARTRGYERQIGLYSTPWKDGGCQGCRFFLTCKGNCPGTALAGDWRLRSTDCRLWFELFQDAERALIDLGKEPISQSVHRKDIEEALVEAWAMRSNPTLASLAERFRSE
jgi:uncharacterized protein